MSCPEKSPKTESVSKLNAGGQRGTIWRQFVQRLVVAEKGNLRPVQGVQLIPLNDLDTAPCPAVHPPLKGVDPWTGVPEYKRNLIVGPWTPSTAEELAEEKRRVLNEEPSRWWWKPRYRLADLERDGMELAHAVAQVRREYEDMS